MIVDDNFADDFDYEDDAFEQDDDKQDKDIFENSMTRKAKKEG